MKTLTASLLQSLADNLGEPEEIEGFRNDDPVAWIQKHFWIPELKGPMQLYPYQQACLKEATRRDETGKFVYSTVVWSDIKKSAKSTIAAGVGLWRAFQVDWGSVYVIANDLKQADSRVSYYMRRAIELNNAMAGVKIKPSGYKITTPSKTIIEAIPIDPKGEAGSNADMIIFSELWGANQKAAKQMWSEMTLSPLKFGLSQRWVETYAGFEGEAPILEMLYKQGTEEGELMDLSFEDELGDFHDLSTLNVYKNVNARLFCLWNVSPRLPWQSAEYYAQEEAILEPSEFERMHRNLWASSLQKFVPDEWVNACQDDFMPPLAPDQSCILVSDAAISGDSFGVLMLSGRGSGDIYDTRYAHAWYPPKGGKIAFQTADQSGPEDEIRRLLKEYNVVEWVYDPFQLEDMAGRFKAELLCHVHPFGQAGPRLIADKRLQDNLKARRFRHRGESALVEHIKNANAKHEGENKLRMVKRNPQAKIDLAVCASMGLDRAQYWQL